MTKSATIEQFYRDTSMLIPEQVQKEVGHFNIFRTDELYRVAAKNRVMPYNRRAYYKISLILGRNRAEYADKVIDIEHNALLFATPLIPYHYVPQDENQAGFFCIFSEDFLTQDNSGVRLRELPVFKPGGNPIFFLNDQQIEDIRYIFSKMFREIESDYAYKYDLLRNYVIELIHFGQKLQPATSLFKETNAYKRVSSLFIELLERQFPVEPPHQKLNLRSAKDYADQLSIHVNYLNKVLKEITGKTTTELISERIIKESKILLKHTDWNVSEIAYSLGFEEASHFNNLFKKHTALSPRTFRA
ncbi:helix-turn-helix domain-containing protein [Dyadobacter endophyticus]|uniref:AraC family transcriptional regulator n=1 Tax=Dyadobacter endophyticus TaxID=1749036 RepID=A0ABQ1YFS2_9BACT|nr:helix-turn-helix transcriptional regulator [Dyadobacter endophyticus]GGH23678.1 AraC family transcriptional regulator [Dyadobacter endophyticus]